MDDSYHLLAIIAPTARAGPATLKYDAVLRQLCEDYEACMEAIRHWSSGSVSDLVRVAEYRRLAAELELEARRHVGSTSAYKSGDT